MKRRGSRREELFLNGAAVTGESDALDSGCARIGSRVAQYSDTVQVRIAIVKHENISSSANRLTCRSFKYFLSKMF